MVGCLNSVEMDGRGRHTVTRFHAQFGFPRHCFSSVSSVSSVVSALVLDARSTPSLCEIDQYRLMIGGLGVRLDAHAAHPRREVAGQEDEVAAERLFGPAVLV